jgi:uncharacterized membrane protein YvbJ
MALITCPECKREVSSQAAQCPQCGYPLAGNAESHRRSDDFVQTIEQTGKIWKLQQLLSALLIIAGVVLVTVATSADSASEQTAIIGGIGVSSLLVGLLWFLFARFFAWWHHG